MTEQDTPDETLEEGAATEGEYDCIGMHRTQTPKAEIRAVKVEEWPCQF